MSGRKTAILVGCAAILAGLVVSYSMAQPERERDERARAEDRERGEMRRLELREREERARDELNARLERLERAIGELMERRGEQPPTPQARRMLIQARPGMPTNPRISRMPMPVRQPDAPNPIEQLERMLQTIERLQRVCFDPGVAGLIAVGAMKDEVRRNPEAAIEQLEDSLKRIKTLGMRNAVRLTLKDMHKALGHEEQVVRHLRAMIEENDKAIQHHERTDRDRPERRGPEDRPRGGRGEDDGDDD